MSYNDDDAISDLDEEEDYDTRRAPKKKKKVTNMFVDEEAEEDEDEEEDYDDEEGEEDGFVPRDNIQDRYKRGNKNVYSREKFGYADPPEREDIASHIQRVYVDGEKGVPRYEEEAEGKEILPSTNDPSLFLVQCKHGKEKEIVLTLMHKFKLLYTTKRRLNIFSAIALPHLKSSFYVEAMKEKHVKDALQGVSSVFASKISKVKIEEMQQVLNLDKITNIMNAFKINDFVRIKRNLYKNDLAQIVEVDQNKERVFLKLVPRIDLQKEFERVNQGIEEDYDQVDSLIKKKAATGRKRGRQSNRPPPKLFDKNEARELGLDIQERSPSEVLYDQKLFRNGFLIKSFTPKVLQTVDVAPTIDELQVFHQDEAVNEDFIPEEGSVGTSKGVPNLEMMAQSLYKDSNKKVLFVKGDKVEVTSSDLRGLKGTVAEHDIYNDEVIIIPKDKSLDALTVNSGELKKDFELGTFVKVLNGKHKDETGHIVKIDDDGTVILYSDLRKAEMQVYLNDIQETQDTNLTESKVGKYTLHSLVSIDNNQNAAVILKIEKDTCKVIDNNNMIRTISIQQMENSLVQQKQKLRITDANNMYASVNDVIKIIDGRYKGKEATIKHIYKNFMFCFARDIIENNGIFCVRNKQCEVRSSTGGVLISASSSGRGTSGQRGGFGAPRNLGYRRKGRHKDTGETVRVKKGVYKGYLGVLRDVNNDKARVELHSLSKVINISSSDYKLENPSNNNRLMGYSKNGGVPYQQRSSMPSSASYATPHMNYPRTPMNRGNETPAPDTGAETPSHYGNQNSSAWDSNVPNSPVPDYDNKYMDNIGGSYGTPSATMYGSSYQNPTTPFVSTLSNKYSTVNTPMGSQGTIPNDHQPSTVQTPSMMGHNKPYDYMYPQRSSNPITPAGFYQTPVAGGMESSQVNTPVDMSYQYNNYHQTLSSVQTPMGDMGGNINPPTPMSSMHSSNPLQTPFQAYGSSIQTPLSKSSNINTPYGSSTVSTPGAGFQSEPKKKELWLIKGLEVKVTEGQYAEKEGYITHIEDDFVLVYITELNKAPKIDKGAITPLLAEKGDNVLIIKGSKSGARGTVRNIDGTNVLVDLPNEDLEILERDGVVRVVQTD